jgi:hypothetical protein
MCFPPFEAEGKQFGEHEPTGEIAYVSAFPTSCQIVRHGKIGQKSRGSKTRPIPVKRPIESIILLFVGVSLLLGLTLMAMALKLLIQLKDCIQLN